MRITSVILELILIAFIVFSIILQIKTRKAKKQGLIDKSTAIKRYNIAFFSLVIPVVLINYILTRM